MDGQNHCLPGPERRRVRHGLVQHGRGCRSHLAFVATSDSAAAAVIAAQASAAAEGAEAPFTATVPCRPASTGGTIATST